MVGEHTISLCMPSVYLSSSIYNDGNIHLVFLEEIYGDLYDRKLEIKGLFFDNNFLDDRMYLKLDQIIVDDEVLYIFETKQIN